MKNIFLLIFLLIFFIICNRCIEKFSVGGSDINISEDLTLSYKYRCDPLKCEKYNYNQMECMKKGCPDNGRLTKNLLECYLNCSNNCSDKSHLGNGVWCNPIARPSEMCPDASGDLINPCPQCGKPACNCNAIDYGPCIDNDDCLSGICQDNLCIRSIPLPDHGKCRDHSECVSENCEDGECQKKKCNDGRECPGDTLCWVIYNNKVIEGRCDESKTCKKLYDPENPAFPDQCPHNLTKCKWDADKKKCEKK